jgi:ribonucleoside-diphosphate reductase alpha chain
MTVYHPDILEFIQSKEIEGGLTTTNISVLVDDAFMNKVKNDETYWTEFGGVKYKELRARDVFNLIVEGAWRNGEPGLLFYNNMNKTSPYRYSNQELVTCNPCGEQSLPFNGVCNLGSLDISKFLLQDKTINLELLETAVRLGIRFLDQVITKSSYPTKDISDWAIANRPTGLGIMGLADYYLLRGVAYGSSQALEELGFIMEFIKNIAEDESILMGEELGVPESCKVLPIPRRNVTLISIAPTGTISLLAGCSSGIEPIFSEIVIRNDKTGSYQFDNDLAHKDFFRCAVSANGATEVTWEEHVKTQAKAQEFVDSGVSKTINFPNHTHRETIAKSFMLAWELGCKGITVYRNGSRKVEVLSPKNVKKNLCPVCESETVKFDGCTKCTKCEWNMCDAQ